jgi:hypothetical protein
MAFLFQELGPFILFLGFVPMEGEIKYLSPYLAQQKEALDSLLANRNSIAHGRNVGITYARVKEYYSHIKDVISLLKEIISK